MHEGIMAARDEIAHNRLVAGFNQLTGTDSEKIAELENLRLHNKPPTLMGFMLEREVMADIVEGLVSAQVSQYPTDPVDESTVKFLTDAGYDTLEKVREASDEDLLAIKGIGEKTVAEIREKVG
jgi:DNA uptake protein ComE-like DNA-binding protein